jgi:hypothetical protein
LKHLNLATLKKKNDTIIQLEEESKGEVISHLSVAIHLSKTGKSFWTDKLTQIRNELLPDVHKK